MTIYTYSTTERNHLLDEYLTPPELIKACIEQAIYPVYKSISLGRQLRVLDVGSNDGRWCNGMRKYFSDAHITGIEIMRMPLLVTGADQFVHADFITHSFGQQFDLIIGNPPYTVKEPNGFDKDGNPKYKVKYKAEDFVRKALSLLSPMGNLFFLLRHNFSNSVERYWVDDKPGLFQEFPLREMHFCVRRPSFYYDDPRTDQYKTKQTNAHDYSMFRWEYGFKGRGKLGWIDWEYKD